MTIARKTGSVKLERGHNKVTLPIAAQVLGFDAIGKLRLVYDAPADLMGIEEIEIYVVGAGDPFEVEADGYTVLGMASPVGTRPVIIYQTWKFPE